MKANITKSLILAMLTIMLISPNFAMASDCNWSTIKTVSDGYLYNNECHHKVGTLVKNEKDFKIEVKDLRKAIDLKNLSIKDLTKDSSMWQVESENQFKRFENYKKAEGKRKWLYIGSGVLGTVLAIYLAGQASK